MIVLGFAAALMVSPITGDTYQSEIEVCREARAVLVSQGFKHEQLRCEIVEHYGPIYLPRIPEGRPEGRKASES